MSVQSPKDVLLGTARHNNSCITEMLVLGKDTADGSIVCGTAMCNFDKGFPHSAAWFEVEALMPDSCKAHAAKDILDAITSKQQLPLEK